MGFIPVYSNRMTYTDISEIRKYAQKGSGYTRTKPFTRATSIILSLFQKGWGVSYLKTAFQNLDDRLLGGWPEELFQEQYMKETAQVQTTLEESLRSLGIKASKIRETVDAIAPLENTCYTKKQLLEIAIEYVLGHYSPISPPNESHFLQPSTLNVWMPHGKKEIMNVPYPCKYTFLPEFSSMVPSSEGTVYFHTTNWRSARHILNCIQKDKSRQGLDFGYKRSFYVSESPVDAIDWGVKNSKRWQNEVAILVFSVPVNFQTGFSYKDLSREKEEWNWAVTSFRNCNEDPDVIEYDEHHDFVYGPMLANPLYYMTEGPRVHTPPVMQLAAKTDAATRFLSQSLKGAFIFRKESEEF